MNTVVALMVVVAVAAGAEYEQAHHEESHHYAPSEYHHDTDSYKHEGGHAEIHLHREPYGVQYHLKEHGPHGSSHYVSFQQKFGDHYEKPSYKGYH